MHLRTPACHQPQQQRVKPTQRMVWISQSPRRSIPQKLCQHWDGRWLSWNSGNVSLRTGELCCSSQGGGRAFQGKSAYSSPELLWKLSKAWLFEEVKPLLSTSLL